MDLVTLVKNLATLVRSKQLADEDKLKALNGTTDVDYNYQDGVPVSRTVVTYSMKRTNFVVEKRTEFPRAGTTVDPSNDFYWVPTLVVSETYNKGGKLVSREKPLELIGVSHPIYS